MARRKIKPVKLVFVGDGTVGKTSMLVAYTKKHFPLGDYKPTVFDQSAGVIECEGLQIKTSIWDLAGQDNYERLRPLAYPCTDIFLMCFSVDNHESYENITAKWYPEIRYHCRKAPIILVGTKIDLRENSENKKLFFSQSQGKKMAAKIKAVAYLECSAKENIGVNEVFEEAAKIVFKLKKEPSNKHQSCILF